MRMMKAEMEFVAFDAQDVIATSGGPLRAKFTMNESFFTAPEGAGNFRYDGYSSWSWEPTGGNTVTQALLLLVNDTIQPVDKGNTVILTAGVSGYTGGITDSVNSTQILRITGAEIGEDSSDTVYTLYSLDEIVAWLNEHGAQ